MGIKIHPHARERMQERGAGEDEVVKTVETGERFPAKFGRNGFRHNFPCEDVWKGKKCNTKQVEVVAVREGEDWTVITILVKYF